jgi:hypothetical protein
MEPLFALGVVILVLFFFMACIPVYLLQLVVVFFMTADILSRTIMYVDRYHNRILTWPRSPEVHALHSYSCSCARWSIHLENKSGSAATKARPQQKLGRNTTKRRTQQNKRSAATKQKGGRNKTRPQQNKTKGRNKTKQKAATKQNVNTLDPAQLPSGSATEESFCPFLQSYQDLGLWSWAKSWSAQFHAL